MKAARAIRTGALEDASQHLASVPQFDREELDRWPWALRVRLAQRSRIGADEVLQGARAWSRERGSQSARADVHNWEGLMAYQRGDFVQAARLHEEAAKGKTHGTGRLSARCNQAAALLEVPSLAEAIQAALALAAEAASLRHPIYEGYAEWFLRVARYRAGVQARPDWELVDAARRLGSGVLMGQLIFQEAVYAWRSGDFPAAFTLATEARRCWAGDGRAALRALPAALAVACADTPGPREAKHIIAPLDSGADALPGLWLQVLGVLVWRFPELRSEWRSRMLDLAQRLPSPMRTGRRELMTVEEAIDGSHTLPSRAMEA